MDVKRTAAVHRLKLVSVPEAVSFVLLLVSSVLKRTTEFNAVPVLGAVHGVLFILYVLFWLDAWNRTRWPLGTAAGYFVAAVLPGGGFVAERRLRRAQEDGVIAARARQEGVVGGS